MRVLMTTDTLGGVWTYSLELARACQEFDVRVDLATLGRRPTSAQERQAALDNVVLHASDFKVEWMPDPWDDVRQAGRWLAELAEDVRPDLIHLNDYSHAALGWRAPVVVVGHSCVLSWHRAVRGKPAGVEWDAYRRHVTAGLRAADQVVAPTRCMADELELHYGPLPSVRVIPNGVAPPAGAPPRKEEVVFAAGRMWDEAKNLAVLRAAAAGVRWPIHVASLADPAGGEVRPGAVRLLGSLDRGAMQAEYGRAAIFAHPARYEPFGLTPLEAAGQGCALALADIPSLREVWGEAALFVPYDAGAWEAALNGLIDNIALRREFAGRARRRAAQLTAARMATRYRDLYHSLTRQPERPAAMRSGR